MEAGTAQAGGPAGGLIQSLSRFAGTLLAILQTRLELLTTELQVEIRQVGAIVLWAVIAALAVTMSLFLAALAVIFVFWDSHRIAATLIMIGLFGLIAVFAILVLKRKLHSKPPMLRDTLAELVKDREQLRAQR